MYLAAAIAASISPQRTIYDQVRRLTGLAATFSGMHDIYLLG